MERYAILIGIDDQFADGLTKCSKDVEDFATALEKKCKFKTKNIFKILSKHGNENKLALNEFENRIELLKNEPTFGSNDILLVYFSGHGEFNISLQQSFLKFPSSNLSTEKVKEYIDILHPKHSIVIFDACFIGSKVFSKSFNLSKLKRKLHIDSEGVFGIYGSPIEREAYLPDDLGNSLLTYYLIQTINDDSFYDEDGFLSIDNLASICSKKVYEHSTQLVKDKKITKEQIIVREGRIEGFLPFAEINVSATLAAQQKKTEVKTQTSKVSTPKTAPTVISAGNLDAEKKDFEILLNAVKNELKNFSPVIASMVISYYSNKPYKPNYDYYKTEINEAIRREIIDVEGDANYRNRNVSALIKAIENLSTFITDSKRSNEFDEYFDSEFDVSPFDSDNQTFWENIYEIDVPNE
jgi:hypothetical protein